MAREALEELLGARNEKARLGCLLLAEFLVGQLGNLEVVADEGVEEES